MFHIKDNFRPGGPISQVPASWFNTVGKFLNNLVGGFGIDIAKDGIPVVSIRQDDLLKIIPGQGEKEEESTESGSPKELAESAGYTAPTESAQALDKKWTQGETETDADGDPIEDGRPVGATFQVISRIVSVGGIAYRFHIRELEIGADGRVKSISKELGHFEVTSM